MRTLLVTSAGMKVSLSFTWHSGAWKPLYLPGRHSKESVTGCLLWYLLQPPAARSCQESHTHPSCDLSLPSLLAAAFLQGFERAQEITGPELPTSPTWPQLTGWADSSLLPPEGSWYFPARPELSQASTSATPPGPLSHQFPFQRAMAIN